ncbi:MAG: hypothetical protein GY729_01555 [Desulfobacteraceae bacterium]|nr:hypothetical protein [Desulfobacteraceae bacterium]
MITIFSIEFWIAVQLVIDFVLIVLLFLFVRRVNRINKYTSFTDSKENQPDGEFAENAAATANDIINMLEPLVVESKNAALSFDEQINEKKRLTKELNDALDSRIISINILLSRADSLLKKLEDRQKSIENTAPLTRFSNASLQQDTIIDQQNKIIALFNQGLDADSIASQLSAPKGEVQLVIDLKKKFIAMEQD